MHWCLSNYCSELVTKYQEIIDRNNFLFNAKQTNIIPIIKLEYFKLFAKIWQIASKSTRVAMATNLAGIFLWVESMFQNVIM